MRRSSTAGSYWPGTVSDVQTKLVATASYRHLMTGIDVLTTAM